MWENSSENSPSGDRPCISLCYSTKTDIKVFVGGGVYFRVFILVQDVEDVAYLSP
jgi:hypothetical protein